MVVQVLCIRYLLISHTGVGSALLGKEAAMACTVAVESVIVEHYNKYAIINIPYSLK